MTRKLNNDKAYNDTVDRRPAGNTAIFKTSVQYQTKHPMLLIFDEPKQQNMAIGNFKSILSELSQFTEQQVLVFASFENSDESFKEATNGLTYSINRIEEKLIKPVTELNRE